MSKKHFNAVANTIRANVERSNDAEVYRLRVLASELADQFAMFNDLFDRARFIRACGVEPF